MHLLRAFTDRRKDKAAANAHMQSLATAPSPSVSADDGWGGWGAPVAKPTGMRNFDTPREAAKRDTYAKDRARSAAMAKQTGKEMAASAAWDKTPEGVKHNEAQAWANKDIDSKSVSSVGGQSQSTNIYNQRG